MINKDDPNTRGSQLA